jgi:hypothetical protein
MRFFVGLHQPSDARHFDACFISVNRLRNRKSHFAVKDWILDSGAFTQINQHGRFIESPEEYAAQIRRWAKCGHLVAAVSQDWMCETDALAKTGLSIPDHQTKTIYRYEAIRDAGIGDAYLLPVLQGFAAADYARHADQYGNRLPVGAWVGVGSICKRNGNPSAIVAVLKAIKEARPDLRLHGFGLKQTAFGNSYITRNLYSADSMAWSFAARKQGRNGNDYREAKRWIGEEAPLL